MMDKNTGYFYLFYCSNRWLAVRLDMMSSCVVCITGLCVVLTYDNLTPAMAGLALSFAIQVNVLDVYRASVNPLTNNGISHKV